jgi:hypothetical protein
MLSAVKEMNQSQKKTLMVEFAEVKFEPVILKSRRDDFAREWKILRASSEGVRVYEPLAQSFRPCPRRSLKNSEKRAADESEMQSRI